jgi:hypothetical protein
MWDKVIFANDPDVLFVRNDNCSLTYQEKLLIAKTDIIFGSQLMYSDDPANCTSKEEKELTKEIIPNFISDLKSKLNTFSAPSNIMLIFVGSIYCFVGIENTTENIMDLMKFLKNDSKMTKSAHIITFNEECPSPTFPVWYKYEGEVYEKESQTYKDVIIPEKAWTLYDNFFCNYGKTLRGIIKTESDFDNAKKAITDEEVKYVKYLPTMNEVQIFEGKDFQDLDEFIDMYLNEVDIEFDNDLVYPYYWPISV